MERRHILNILGIILICLGWVLAYLSHSLAVGIIVTIIAISILVGAYISRKKVRQNQADVFNKH